MFANMGSSLGPLGCARARLAGSMRALSKLLQQGWLPLVRANIASLAHWLLSEHQPTCTLDISS